jgi:hypothetical protein
MRNLAVLLFALFALSVKAAEPGPRFLRNEGQWEPSIRFRADLPGGVLLLRANGLHYIFYDAADLAARHDGRRADAATAGLRAHGLDLVFEGANPAARLEAAQPDGVPRAYFLGNRQAARIQGFGEVWYRQVYPGVDLRLYAYQAGLKYEFVVAPGADPSVIRLRYDGADELRLENGNLRVRHSLGELKELQPYSYQEVSRGRTAEVSSGFSLRGNRLSFAVGDGYDPRLPLTIDPVLVFSTFSGSVADNWGHTATYDAAGNLYSGGSVLEITGFPTTLGAFQVEGGGNWDVGILKFSPDGTQLLYATYLGGSEADIPHSLIVNPAGELVLFGTTSSKNFPTTASAYDRSFNGGTPLQGSSAPVGGMNFVNGSDVFVAKLSPDGSRLLGSTYLGGSANDGLNLNRELTIENYGDAYRGEVMTDSLGRVYVASLTASPDFPLVNSTQNQRRGTYDAVLLRLSADLSRLEWSTLLGGSGFDAAYGLRVGKSGAVYACGVTSSADLGGTAGAFKPSLDGKEDGFVAKFSPQLGLAALTYLGTADAEVAELLDVDGAENVYVLGLSSGGKYPVTTGTYRNAGSSQFIQALDNNLSKSLFSTVVGSGRGAPDLVPTAFLVSECGNLYLAGWGGSINATLGKPVASRSSTRGLPVTPDAFRPTTDGNNFYLMMLETGAKSLLYATFFGSTNTSAGDHVDGGTCRFDKRGFVYHAACSCNRPNSPANFTTTPGAWSRSNPSYNCNNAAFKFDIDRLKVSFDVYQGTKKDSIGGCLPLTLRFVNTSEGGKRYDWDIRGPGLSLQTSSAGTTEIGTTLTQAGTYTITLKGTNPLSCLREATATRTLTVGSGTFSLTPDSTVCAGQRVQLRASGGVSYQWSPAQTLSSATAPDPVATPQATTTYTVQVTDAAGCRAQRNVTLTVDDRYRPTFSIRQTEACGQPTRVSFRLDNSTADRYLWLPGNGDTLRAPQPDGYVYPRPGTYQVSVRAFKGGCSLTATQPVVVEPPLEVPNVITPNGDGKNDVLDLGRRGLKLEIYNRWGKPVLLTDDYPNTWGPGVPVGTYYYLLTAPGGTKCKGWLEVMQ